MWLEAALLGACALFAILWLRTAHALDGERRVCTEQAAALTALEHDKADLEFATAQLRAAAERPAPVRPALTAEQVQAITQNRCTHCGGSHAIACPRVKRLRMKPDGVTLAEVEFWPDADWPKDRVVFPEDMVTSDEPEVVVVTGN